MKGNSSLYVLVFLGKSKKLTAAEFSEGIMASLSRNQDETPGLKQRKVCNFFMKKSCRMERPKCICNRMTHIEGQAIGQPILPEGTIPGMQNISSLIFDVEDDEERKKRRRMSY
uniref:uncharacterized protein LOC105353422 n=1 Tax=Fragaria vesca subsp. vesca TaxID=101020 RepID=UPI0005CAE91D|nr:PREDICTED: uncharacterized protein LOC105353422 [Fragaria vesca subsp. vesca]